MSVNKNNRTGKWECRWRDENGRPRSKSYTLKRDAERHDRQIKDAKEKGDMLDPDKANMVMATFFAEVFLPTRVVTGNTRKGYGARWGSVRKDDDGREDPEKFDLPWHVRRKWGNVRLRDCNKREAVLRWHGEMKAAGATEAQIERAHDLFINIMGVAEDFEYLTRLKVRGIYPTYTPPPKDDVWGPDEIETLARGFLSLGQDPPPRISDLEDYRWRRERDAAIVRLWGYQPMRTGEVFALDWRHVLDDKRIGSVIDICEHIPGVDEDERRGTKTTEDGRIAEIIPIVRADLRDWWIRCGQPSRGPVFPRTREGGEWSASSVKGWRATIWRKAQDRAGLKRQKPKHMRDSAVSMWIRRTGDLVGAAEAAGHGVAVCSKTYARTLRNVRAAVADGQGLWDMEGAIRAARESDVRPMCDRAIGEGR